MRTAMLLACALWALPVPASAQSSHQVGWHDVVLANPSGFGSPALAARIAYPAAAHGRNVPVLPQAGGWPVIVFLHGYAQLGRDYQALGEAWARAGFVVAQLDTAQWNFLDLWDDGIAMFGALGAANAASGTLLAGAFDMQRVGIAGHSMGGATTGLVLACNPGYRCGLALAPVFPGVTAAGMVTVPFGIVVGTGDMITPPGIFAEPFFEAVASQHGLKFLYTMNVECDHMNVAGLSMSPTPDVFARVVDVGAAFFRHFLLEDSNAIERCVGPTALAESRLVSVQQRIAEPRVWASRPLRIGRRTRLSLAAEEGIGAILVAGSTAPAMPTVVGTLLLDPASAFAWRVAELPRERRIDAMLEVPDDPLLAGFTIAFQAIGATPVEPLLLGTAVQFTITP